MAFISKFVTTTSLETGSDQIFDCHINSKVWWVHTHTYIHIWNASYIYANAIGFMIKSQSSVKKRTSSFLSFYTFSLPDQTMCSEVHLFGNPSSSQSTGVRGVKGPLKVVCCFLYIEFNLDACNYYAHTNMFTLSKKLDMCSVQAYRQTYPHIHEYILSFFTITTAGGFSTAIILWTGIYILAITRRTPPILCVYMCVWYFP